MKLTVSLYHGPRVYISIFKLYELISVKSVHFYITSCGPSDRSLIILNLNNLFYDIFEMTLQTLRTINRLLVLLDLFVFYQFPFQTRWVLMRPEMMLLSDFAHRLSGEEWLL